MKRICDFCFRHCTIDEGDYGWCRRRRNEDGKIVSVGYGRIPAMAIDPVEKKPLYHFLPGTKTLSIGASGCNLSCDFCQNWQLSQIHEEEEYTDERDVTAYAVLKGYPSISFTYSEPLVWQDFMLRAAESARRENLRTVMVTNGSFSREAIERIIPAIDAFNVDVKGDSTFYRSICHGELEPVLNAVKSIVDAGKHLEVTTMVIEGIHTAAMIKETGRILRDSGVQVWHLTRFYPAYKMNNREPTSELFLSDIIKEAKETGIPFIYPGNSVLSAPTVCPDCGRIVRQRPGGRINGECPYCGRTIYGIWK